MTDTHLKDLKEIVKGLFLENELMSKHTSYGVGGPVKAFIIPKDRLDLINILKFSNNHNIETYFIGSGSNILFSDNEIDGIVISPLKSLRNFNISNNTIIAESGVMLGKMVKESIKNGLTGLESLIGVPGTLGGALSMNAGAYGSEISNHLISVKMMSMDGKIKGYARNHLKFSYRNSNFKSNEFILEAKFVLESDSIENIKTRTKKTSSSRKANQPLRYRSAGSVFKNPKEGPAGYFIEKAGLKGLRSGNAEISKKHANFFINYGDAKAEDVVKLILTAKKSVKKLFNINLELEIQTLGFKKGTFQL